MRTAYIQIFVKSMSPNYGKEFESIIKKSIEQLGDTSIIRLHDQTTGFIGSSNICDFIAYRYPYEYLFECKSIHGNTFPYSNISDVQLKGMTEMSNINGVFPAVICWWVDHDVTKILPIQIINDEIKAGHKSIRYDSELGTIVPGKKKRVFFEYDFSKLL